MAEPCVASTSKQRYVVPAALLRPGVEMLKVSTKSSRRVKNRRMWLDLGTGHDDLGRLGGLAPNEIACCWEKSSRPLGGAKYASIPLSSIKDIRFGTAGSPYRTALHLSPAVEPRWITIIYALNSSSLLGPSGQYKLAHFIAPDERTAELWREAFEWAREGRAAPLSSLSGDALERDAEGGEWSRDDMATRVVKEEEVLQLCKRLGMGLATKDVVRAFKETAAPKDQLDFVAFQRFVKVLKRRRDVESIFDLLSGPFNLATWTSFLTDTQKSSISQERIESLFQKYQDVSTGLVQVEGFLAYLLSSENAPMKDEEMDMSRPLVEYYINSSHNTYLVGGQLQGDSTVEGYIRALQQGCRCVELDVWSGDDRPVITHGRTLTSSIPVEDALRAINTYAFLASPYPVILSFEIHCDPPQQDMLAESLVNIFGEQLVSERLDASEHGTEIEKLPSPDDLKGRVLLKAKNLFVTNLEGDKMNVATAKDIDTSSTESSSDSDFKKVFANVRSKLDRRSSSASSTQIPTLASTRRQSSGGSFADAPVKPPKVAMSPALAALIVYTVGVKARGFNKKETYAPTHVLSFGERAIEKMIKDDEARRELIAHNRGHLTRSYPSGKRVRSTNYLPNSFWAAGVQMAAVNWQTFDAGMAMNSAMFSRAGGSGYLLKPEILRKKGAAKDKDTLNQQARFSFQVQVVSAQQLPRPRGEKDDAAPLDPFVEVSLLVPGTSQQASSTKRRTQIVTANAFNPQFGDVLKFEFATHPSHGFLDLVFVRFDVLDARQNRKAAAEEGKGDPVASYTISLGSLQPGTLFFPLYESCNADKREGYRHTPLFDSFGNQLLFGSLFIRSALDELPPSSTNQSPSPSPASHLRVPSAEYFSLARPRSRSRSSERILDGNIPLASSPPTL